MGVLRELVDALPLAPNGNLVSKAPERELEEVLGRLAEPPNEPQPLPWLLLLFVLEESCSRSIPESFPGVAVAGVTGLHADEGSFGGVAGGMHEE